MVLADITLELNLSQFHQAPYKKVTLAHIIVDRAHMRADSEEIRGHRSQVKAGW